jgi:flagellar biosynthesis/type III secretory pathway protein FliH
MKGMGMKNIFEKVRINLDMAWLAIADRAQGFYRGAASLYAEGFDVGDQLGFAEGYKAGTSVGQKTIEAKLEAYNPNLSSPEFTLGYEHAVAVAKGEVK